MSVNVPRFAFTAGLCFLLAQTSLEARSRIPVTDAIFHQQTTQNQQTLRQQLDAIRQRFGVSILMEEMPELNQLVPAPKGRTADEQLRNLLSPFQIEVKEVRAKTYALSQKPKNGSRPVTNTSTGGVSVQETKVIQSISGRVLTDESGEPLAGVSILIKGTLLGTMTSDKGEFRLDLPEGGSTLVFSFVGYKTQEVIVTGQRVLDIRLKMEAARLDEVVVTGYGNKSIRELTGAAVQVQAEDLQNVTSSTLLQNLQGKLAGVNVANAGGGPAGYMSIMIRGAGSLGGSFGSAYQPLVVVDGIIQASSETSNALAYLAPQDIASVTVLKDAASTALYGSRAANGVIVITTKQGKSGPTRITANVTMGVNEPTLGKVRMMNSAERYDLLRQAYGNTYRRNNPTASDEAVAAYLNQQAPASLLTHNTNWNDLVYQKGITRNYEIGISGGNDKIKNYTGLNLYSEDPVKITDLYRRLNFRTNTEFTLNKRMVLSTALNGLYNSIQSDGLINIAGASYDRLPFDSPYRADGSYRLGGSADPNWQSGALFNPLYSVGKTWTKSRNFQVNADVTFRYHITDWIRFETANRLTLGQNSGTTYVSAKDSASFMISYPGYITKSQSQNQNLLTSNRLFIEKTYGVHDFKLILGAEYNRIRNEGISSSGLGLQSDLLTVLGAKTVSASENIVETRYASLFSELTYSLKNRYFLTGSFRRDGSSRFGVNSRYGNFYAFSGAWQISDEAFLQNNTVLTNLKLRVSHGITGNSNPVNDYVTYGLYSFVSSPTAQYLGQLGAIPSQIPNANLQWERQQTTNLGLDFSLWKRLNVTMEFYDKRNFNLLQSVPLPTTSGFSSIARNVGSIGNKGIELSINSLNTTGKLRWETDFNIAYNRNKVLALTNNNADIYRGSYSGTLLRVGEALGTYYMPKYAGVDPQTGNPLWEVLQTDGNGSVTDITTTPRIGLATLQVLGSAQPKWVGGLTNTLSYKNFSLSVLINFSAGYKILNRTRNNLELDGSSATVNNIALPKGQVRWQKPGDIADAPAAIIGGNQDAYFPNSRYVESGDFARLRNVRLGYSLPRPVLSRLKMQNLTLFVSGDNLLTLTRFTGIDPEENGSFGEENSGKYPFARKYLAGLQLSF